MSDVDRRTDGHRRRVLKTGLISTDGHFTAMECLVRDISANGARLHAESTLGIPQSFDLYVIAENFMRPAAVRWRHGNQMGVRFFERPVKRGVAEKVAKLKARRTDKPFPPVPASMTRH